MEDGGVTDGNWVLFPGNVWNMRVNMDTMDLNIISCYLAIVSIKTLALR